MKDKSKIILIAVILIVAAVIAYICYGIKKGSKNPLVTMEVSYLDKEGNEKTGIVKIELYPDVAPESVANFIALANNGFYDGLTFHRIAKNFVIQGGDKDGNGTGSANYTDIVETYTIEKIENGKAKCKKTTNGEEKEFEVSKLPKDVKEGDKISKVDGKFKTNVEDYKYTIKGEFAANAINNNLKFEKGVIAMARSDYSSYGLTEDGYNSASSQFFFLTTDDKTAVRSLNQSYAPFGKVVEGYEFLEEIAEIYAVDENAPEQTSEEKTEEKSEEENKTEEAAENGEKKEEDKSAKVPKMKTVRVETYGANYGLPKLINAEETLNKINEYQNYYQSIMNSSQSSSDAGIQVVPEGSETQTTAE